MAKVIAKIRLKENREYDRQNRKTWGFSPVERIKTSKKVYDRREAKKAVYE